MASTRIGLISDTHGLLRPEALQGVDRILHLGDIGRQEILDQLGRIAPIVAVRGNNDTGGWAEQIPETQLLAVHQHLLFLIHDLKQLKSDPATQGYQVVLAGHSHKPMIERRHKVLYVNPGSAGPRRFKLPVTVGFLEVTDEGVEARIEPLPI